MLFSGSLSSSFDTDATRFFAGSDCRALDYAPAVAAWEHGDDPMDFDRPIHASYEDKPDVPDRIFFDLDDAAYERQVASWQRHFTSTTSTPTTPTTTSPSSSVSWTPSGSGSPSVVHLHHLTPMHEAASLVWPDAPVITHLHGTELKMLAIAMAPGAPVGRWTRRWVRRMQRWARNSARIITVSDHDAELAAQLLPGVRGRIDVVGNGVDVEVFRPRNPTAAQRAERWRGWLVDEPLGWSPDGGPGSVRYELADLQAFVDPTGAPVPVVLFAGRFMAFKRLSLLIEAHHRARAQSGVRSVLVVVGGFPGEWEGEHPLDTVARLGAQDVFFAGWRSHAELSDFLACADIFAAPSFHEPFGLVYLEAMAAGVPPIATDSGGPATFINTDPAAPTGWLVEPDDLDALTSALVDAVSEPSRRMARGANAGEFVRANYSWSRSASVIAGIYADVAGGIAGRPTSGVA